MKIANVALLGAGLLSLAAIASPASAASPVTEAFVSNLEANIAFLNQASHMAGDRSKSAAIRKSAQNLRAEQTKVASRLGDTAPSSFDSLEVATGRSAAIDGAAPQTPAAPLRKATNGKMPLGQAEIAQLRDLSGTSFDAAYTDKQRNALSQIELDYRVYIETGDDPALVAMAKVELPKVTRRLDQLGRI